MERDETICHNYLPGHSILKEKWIFSLKGFKVKQFQTKQEAVDYANKIYAPG